MNTSEPNQQLHYVAPNEPIPARRPPTRETGVIGWLRENLFNSLTDTIITLITLTIAGALLWNILSWAIFEAQWELIFLNLRILNVGGQFPASQVWRAEFAALIILFLGLLTVGVFGRILRVFLVIIAIFAALVLIVPPLSKNVEKPLIHTYVDANYALRQMNFLAEAGQTVTFFIDPLTDIEDYRINNVKGYVEKDSQLPNSSFDAYNNISTEVAFTQQRDPSLYDLNVAVQVWDSKGNIIAESPFSAGSSQTLSFEWTAPAAGWYTYTAIRAEDAPGSTGVAWLKAANIDVYRNTVSARGARLEQYGEQPALIDCDKICATETNRTDMRFIGDRTLAQWFSLQLTPFFEEIRNLFFAGLLVGAAGYVLGRLAQAGHLHFIDWGGNASYIIRFVLIMLTFLGLANLFNIFEALQANGVYLIAAGLISVMIAATDERNFTRIMVMLFIAYLMLQVYGIAGDISALGLVYSTLVTGVCAIVTVYAIIQLTSKKGSNSRAVMMLWAISFPIILTLINGIAGVETLPQIQSNQQGGLLLTLLLSAVAIIVSFPIGLFLALGRQSNLPIVSFFCTLFIEVVRGVPLITLLFMGRLILPFFGLGLGDVDLLIRVMVVLTLFTSAYLAEVMRGGLQTVPKGQLEAAHALGLNDYRTNSLIVLPQALRAVIPAIMGQAISLFKDTSLVYVIGLFELVGTMNVILGDSQTGYLMFPREGYLYVGILFFVFSFIMAEASRRIEKTGSGAIRRETL